MWYFHNFSKSYPVIYWIMGFLFLTLRTKVYNNV